MIMYQPHPGPRAGWGKFDDVINSTPRWGVCEIQFTQHNNKGYKRDLTGQLAYDVKFRYPQKITPCQLPIII